MANNCPHCGAELPPVSDAFCPECRLELEAAPPRTSRSAPPDFEQDATGLAAQHSASQQRPLGISILAILHFGGGTLVGALLFPLLAKLGEMEGPLRTVGLTPTLLVIGLGFLASLGVAAGVGMWLGRKWGWWLGAFYYFYGFARNAMALLTIAELADGMAGSARGLDYYYAKHTTRMVVQLLILLYFFKGNVLHYFGLEDLSKWKAISALVGVCVAISGVFSVVASFAS